MAKLLDRTLEGDLWQLSGAELETPFMDDSGAAFFRTVCSLEGVAWEDVESLDCRRVRVSVNQIQRWVDRAGEGIEHPLERHAACNRMNMTLLALGPAGDHALGPGQVLVQPGAIETAAAATSAA